ncbi:MAG: hypothetical protein HY812_22440 [Planctomycetes bacterium]|nr:hypothetical protein [Planctomycetota bacterium]
MRVFAEGKNSKYAKYRKVLQDKFVCMCDFAKSTADEHGKRGPKGPYQHENQAVPVLVMKKWNGDELAIKYGFPTDKETAPALLAKLIDQALDENGPITRPSKKDLKDNPKEGKDEEEDKEKGDKDKKGKKDKQSDKDKKEDKEAEGEEEELAKPPSRPGEPDVPVPVPEGNKMRWVGSYEKALVEAKLRNVPILVVLGEDTNTALDFMLGTVFLQASFGEKVVDRLVPLIAMEGDVHPSDDKEIDGQTYKICKIFSVPCAEHIASYKELQKSMIFRSYWGPLFLILRPDGNEILRLEGKDHKTDRFLEEIDLAVAEVGRGMDDRTYRRYIGCFDRSRRLRAEGSVQKGLAELDKVLEGGASGPAFAEFVAKEKEEIEKKGQEELSAALQLAAAGDAVKALASLRNIAREYAGLPVQAHAQAEIEKLKGK